METQFVLCLACEHSKHEKCWGTWHDHLDNVPWKCDCWECALAIWQTYEQLPKDADE